MCVAGLDYGLMAGPAVPAASADDALVAKGLAKRGTDVAPEAMPQAMTLKEMETVAAGVEHKKFTRRAPAIEFLSGLPDLQERLGRHVSLREI